MTQTAHEWMLEIVKVAEELGYFVRYVGVDTIGLTRPYCDIDISGRFVNEKLLRQILQPQSKEGATP